MAFFLQDIYSVSDELKFRFGARVGFSDYQNFGSYLDPRVSAIYNFDESQSVSMSVGRYTKTPKVIAREISKNIILFSKQYKLSPELILGIIEVESMFNSRLESSAGARGLMQVMPEWVPKLGLKNVNDLHEIDIGIESGIKVFLIHLEEAKGSISDGLYRYVNKDYKYVERVYSSVGRFVTYRTTLEKSERISRKGEDSDKTGKRARLNSKRTPESSIS